MKAMKASENAPLVGAIIQHFQNKPGEHWRLNLKFNSSDAIGSLGLAGFMKNGSYSHQPYRS